MSFDVKTVEMSELTPEEAALAALNTELEAVPADAVEPVIEEVIPPVVELTTEVEPPAPAPAPADPEEAKGRFRLEGKLAAVAQLTKGGMSEEEAIDRIYGRSVAPEPEPQEPEVDPVAQLEAELQAIGERLDAASEDQSLYTPEIRKDMKREVEIREELRVQKARLEANQNAQVLTAQQQWDADWDNSAKWVVEHYDDASNPESPLSKGVSAEIAEIANNPKHPFYGNPNLPKILYAQHAADLGIAPKKAAANPASAKIIPIYPASGGHKTSPPPVQNQAQIQADFTARQSKAIAEGDFETLRALNEESLTGNAYQKRNRLQLSTG